MGSFFLGLSKALRFIWPTFKPLGAFIYYRNKMLSVKGDYFFKGPDVFFIKCNLKEKDCVQFLVQIESERILYSKVHQLLEGENVINIPLNGILDGVESAKVFVSPLDDTNTKIDFSWLDFFYGVREDKTIKDEKPADKVKVLAWDLDNTLWDGILVEDESVSLRQEAVDVIKELDARGILCTIVSKNNHEEAMAKLKEFGIEEYFLSPAINWGRKSQNLKAIAENLNLGINSFAFIDDNIRERSEMFTSLPMVRVYADTDMGRLLTLPEFDVPVTEASRTRRQSYLQEVSRKELLSTFKKDDYDSFLKGLEMTLTVEEVGAANNGRCYELLQRSNQLNLSTHRYSKEEYDMLIASPDTICRAFRVKDKFGDYGIVSFVSIKLNSEIAEIVDFVISCRVAKKKVEQAIIISLKGILIEKGVSELKADLIKTKKNGPLASVFEDLPFSKLGEDQERINYSLTDLSAIENPEIIKIERISQ